MQRGVSGKICKVEFQAGSAKVGFGEGPQASIWRNIQGRHSGGIHREELKETLGTARI